MIKDIFIGMSSYFQHFPNISKYGLWRYALVPSLLGLVFFFLLGFTSIQLGDNIGEWMISWYKWDFGSSVVAKISHWIGGLLIAVLGLLIAKYVVILIASPFMSPMSEKIDEQILGAHDQKDTSGLMNAAKGLARGLRITFRLSLIHI